MVIKEQTFCIFPRFMIVTCANCQIISIQQMWKERKSKLKALKAPLP